VPVRKYRSGEEIPDATFAEPGSPELWRAIQTVWAWADLFSPPRFPAGVHKHRSVAEWNAMSDRWERDAVARARARSVDDRDAG